MSESSEDIGKSPEDKTVAERILRAEISEQERRRWDQVFSPILDEETKNAYLAFSILLLLCFVLGCPVIMAVLGFSVFLFRIISGI